MGSEDEYRVKIDDREYRAKVVEESEDRVIVEVEGRRFIVEFPSAQRVPQVIEEAKPVVRSREQTQKKAPETRVASPPKTVEAPQTAAAGKVIRSNVPGKVVEVLKREGDHVSVNETVLKMESMKMIIEIKSPHEGRIKKLHVKAGEYVNPGTVLAELE